MTPETSGFADPSALVRPLDEEQARLVEILEAAGGEPVTFEHFRARGIENPAMLAYELEIAGFPIVHVHRRRPGGQSAHVGIRLERPWPGRGSPEGHPTRYGAAAAKAASATAGVSRSVILASRAAGAASARTARHAAARLRDKMPERSQVRRLDKVRELDKAREPDKAREVSRGREPNSKAPRRGAGDPAWWVLGGGLAAIALIGLILLLASGSTPSRRSTGRDAASASAQGERTVKNPFPSGAARQSGAGAHKRSPSARNGSAVKSAASSTPMDRATELQLTGHNLLEEGRYAAAIGELRGALRAGGQSVSNCAEPTTPSCLTYAHALYDLGRALALDHAPAAAHAVLTERLRIDNQRGLVEKQLALARRQHYRSSTPTRTPATRHHQSRPHEPSHEQSPPAPPHPNPGGTEAPAATADTAAPVGGSREGASA